MKNILRKYWVFILGVLISTIINFYHFIPSFYLDGYCSLCEGFGNYALTFVKSGRYLTAAIYSFTEMLNINPNTFSVLSVILSNIILSVTMQIIYNDIISLSSSSKKTKLIAFIGAFLICFNPFNIEIYLFEESFVMCFGILASILAGSVFFANQRFSFVKSLLLLFIATCCYQSTLALFIPYVFLLTCLKNKDKNVFDNIKDNYKFYIKGLICYGVSLILSFVLLKIILLIFNMTSSKMGELNIIWNIKNIVFLLKDMLSNLFNIVNTNCFYFLLISILFMLIGYVIVDIKHNYSKLIYIFVIVLLCVITAFVPNLVMSSSSNYTAARMTTSIGAINGFILLLSLLFEEKKRSCIYLQNIICIIGISTMLFYSFTYLSSARDNFNRYQKDMKYINNIDNVIKLYENGNQKKLNIKFAISSTTEHYYKKPYNTINIRVNDVDWGFYCILNYLNPNSNIGQITEQEINTLNLIETENFKYLFDENTMYLLIW